MLILLLIIITISALIGVPFLPTHRRQAELMMELAGVKEGTRVIDLGSGAGRLLFLAARRGAQATGYELNPFLYVWTKIMISLKGLSEKIVIKCQSLYTAPLDNVDVVFVFLFPAPMQKLSAQLFTDLKPGAKIVSYAFPINNREPLVKKEGIYVYVV